MNLPLLTKVAIFHEHLAETAAVNFRTPDIANNAEKKDDFAFAQRFHTEAATELRDIVTQNSPTH